jgi:hypothetical protein
MPIIGWACPVCSRQVPLDHYAVSECGLRIHPAYAAAILYDEATDPHGERMSVTDGLGCPRHAAIENQEGVYVNPLDYNALLIGRGWDSIVGDAEIIHYGAPALRLKVQLHGTIASMEVTGEADNIRRLGDMLILSDWKHSNNFRQKYLKLDAAKEPPEAPSMEYKIQTSIYAELYRQTFGESPTHGEVVYHFSGAGKDVLLPMQYSIMPLAECLAYKPYSGQYTVEELYRMAQTIYGPVPEDHLAAKRWAELPLVGQTMAFGSKSYCDYCEVKDVCFTAARGAPF